MLKLSKIPGQDAAECESAKLTLSNSFGLPSLHPGHSFCQTDTRAYRNCLCLRILASSYQKPLPGKPPSKTADDQGKEVNSPVACRDLLALDALVFNEMHSLVVIALTTNHLPWIISVLLSVALFWVAQLLQVRSRTTCA